MMNRQITATSIAIGALVFSGSLLAGSGSGYLDTAKVVDADPIYENVEIVRPEERCWNERVTHKAARHGKSYTPTIAGAIIGGVVGNQFGKGSGKDALTVAGALLGGSIGRDIGHRRHHVRYYTTTERRCETIERVSYEEQLVGYRVKYKYKGKIFYTQTREHPGKRIRVRVNVDPVQEHDGWYSEASSTREWGF